MYRDSQLGLCIDLSGPDGNAFCLMGYAKDLARQIGVPSTPIINEMMSGDYGNLLKVFEENFPVVTLLNKPGESDDEWSED
jgi:hypothetical protein